MKFFVTKYALTQGIAEVDGEPSTVSPELLCWKIDGYTQTAYGKGEEWHETLDLAKAHAERMRLRKISSLNKALKKMEALNF